MKLLNAARAPPQLWVSLLAYMEDIYQHHKVHDHEDQGTCIILLTNSSKKVCDGGTYSGPQKSQDTVQGDSILSCALHLMA